MFVGLFLRYTCLHIQARPTISNWKKSNKTLFAGNKQLHGSLHTWEIYATLKQGARLT